MEKLNIKRCLLVLLLVIVGVCLTGLFVRNRARASEKIPKVQAKESRKGDIFSGDEAVSHLSPDLQADARVILSNTKRKFFAGHPVKADFLGWFAGVYGKAVLHAIAEGGVFDDPEVWYEATGKSMQVLWTEYQRDSGSEKFNRQRVSVIESASGKETVFCFTGDLNLGEGIATTKFMDKQPNSLSNGFSQELLNKMRDADVFVINNEFCYSDRGEALAGKDYCFRGDPERAAQLFRLGTDLVGLANNHVYDYGPDAFYDTLSTLKGAGLSYVGAGANLEEASEPMYYIANGRKIAVVAATQIERHSNYTKEATEDEPGVLKCLNPEYFVKAIREAKKNADTVLCFVHWGTEGVSQYGADQEELAEAFVEAGADAVVGGHPHCLQGIEFVEDVPVYYSLGNYWFAVTGDMPEDYDTGLAELHISKKGKVSAYFLPCRFSQGVTRLCGQEEGEEITQKMNGLSGGAQIAADGRVSKKE